MKINSIPQYLIQDIVKKAIVEDLGYEGDLTTQYVIEQKLKGKAYIVARQNAVLAGMQILYQILQYIDPQIKIINQKNDADIIKKNQIVATLEGNIQNILTAERILLNFLGHLSGIATKTRKYVKAVKNSKTKISCTRKTIPSIRVLQKYAVTVGGGVNHRFGLYDAILIKDNHIASSGNVANAIEKVLKRKSHAKIIEVEVDNIEQLKQAIQYDIQYVMLDNMTIKQIEKAVAICNDRVKIEVSGNISIKKAVEIAKYNVDLISVGRLTHSVECVDFGLDM